MTKIAVLVVFIILLILVGPLVTIWSLNTLFGLDIAYTFWTWLAMCWIGAVLSAKFGQKSS